MRSSFLVAGLLALALTFTACKGDPTTPPEGGEPTLVDSPLAETTVGVSYSASLGASGGTAPYTFSTQGLPPGISLNSDSGALSGTATTAGDFQVQVTVKDANGKQASKSFALKVYPGVSFKQSTLPEATAEFPYSATVELDGGKAPVTLRVSVGDLPTGVNLNAATRQLSGAFPAAGTLSLTFEATDAHGAKATQRYSVTVAEALRLGASLPSGNVGLSYSWSLGISGGRAPLTSVIESGVLPPGLQLNGGVISGTPTTAGRFALTVRVTDANGASRSAAITLDIFSYLPPQLPAATLPSAIVGKPYSERLLGAEGAPPYTFTVLSGSLPAGLSLSSAGIISGTPTTVETQSFSVQLTDSQGQRAQRVFTLVTQPQLVVQTTALAEGYQSQFYNQTLVAAGGKPPYRWEAQGSLPPGLTLTTAGILSGTPTVAGSYGLTFSLTDASGQLATGAFQLTLFTQPVITTATLADGAVGVAYNQRLRASGGKPPYAFSITGGVLPPGIVLTGDTLNGTPTSAVTSNVTVQVTDANGKSSSRDLDLRIFNGLTITTATLDDAYVGRSYAVTLTAVAGDTSRPYTWAAVGPLPAGLTLSTAGVLSGTATASGTTRFTAQVTDNSGASTTRVLDLRVLAPPSVATASLPEAFQGAAYSTTLSGADGLPPYQWRVSAGTLPEGLTLSTAGVLSGTPPTAGTSSFTVELTDANGVRGSRALSLFVATLAITTASLNDGYTGQPYSATLAAAGGPTPFTWTVTGLPAGLSYDASTGMVSGTPVAAATTSLNVRVTDALNRVANRTLSLAIHAPPQITTAALAEGFTGVAYTQVLEASNGKAPYTWSLTGTLPTGLTFSEVSGVWGIRGTPSEAGTRSLTFQLTDANGKTASRTLSLTITAPLALTTASLPDTYEGRAYDQTLTATGGRGSYTFDRAAGALPGGLSLSPAGRISGTVATGATTGTFTARVTDANNTQATRDLSIAVYALPAITTSSYAEGYTGEAYSAPTTATGGKAPLTWSVASGTLPTGLVLNAATGLISGTPTQAGTASFTLKARDANGEEATRALQLSLYAPPTVSTASPLPGAYAGLPYSLTFTGTGGKAPLSFSLASGTLPASLGLSPAGVLSGTLSASTPHATLSAFSVRVTDANGRAATRAFELTTYKRPEILSTSLTTATEGVGYRRSEASAERVQTQYGQGALSYSATGLPPGLSLSPSTGDFSGTPAQGSAGSYTVTVTVTDAGNQSASAPLRLTVVAPKAVNYGGVVGLAPAGSRITDTLTVFVTNGRSPLAGVGVRVRKNGVEYSPAKEGLTNAEGKVVLTGLGLNGTTDTVDITANGQELVNTTLAGVNASLVTLRMYANAVPGPRLLAASAYDPASRRFLISGGFDSSTSNSLFFSSCLNDMVEAVNVDQKSFTTRVPGGLTTSPSPRYEAAMSTANGTAVLFGGRTCIDSGDALGDTWEYNLSSNTWTQTNPSTRPSPRRGAAMVREPSGNSVLLVGGYRVPSYSNEMWRYTPSSDTWTLVGTAPFSKAWMAATPNLSTGEIWFCGGRGSGGGDTCYSLNPTTLAWTPRPTMPSARAEFSLASDPNTGILYAYGGRDNSLNLFGDLLLMRPGATAWESVIPAGPTPAPRYGHVMYYDMTQRRLVMGLGSTRNPTTFVTTRLGDLWTFDGTTWTERGAPAPTPPGYTVSGEIFNGATSGFAEIRIVTTSGYATSTTATLDFAGHGTYAVPNIPPGEAAFITVVGMDPDLEYPNDLWSYTDVELPPLAGNLTVNHSLPPGPAIILRSAGQFVLPSSWRGQQEDFAADEPLLDVPGFTYVRNGSRNPNSHPNQFDVSFLPTAAPRQQRVNGYVASQLLCEDHGIYNVIGSGNQNIAISAAASALTPGQPECIPAGPRGVGTARSRAYVYEAERTTVADLDGDTFPDLVTPYPTTAGISILYGNPNTLTLFTEDDCCDVGANHSLAVGDFNRDGKPDVALTNTLYGSISVKLGLPGRAFGPAVTYTVGTTPTGIATADVNQDGILDLIVANQGSNNASYLSGRPDGTFNGAQTFNLAGTSPTTVIAAHLDGDTRPDLAVLVAEGVSITLDGTTQGPFGTSTLLSSPQPVAMVVGRLNGDTLPDLALSNLGNNTVSVHMNAGGGTFSGATTVSAGFTPAGLVLAELTGDTHLDLAVTYPNEGVVTLLQGASNGVFSQHSRVPVPGAPRNVVALDFNQDGLNDLAVSSPSTHSVSLLLGQRPLPTSSGNTFSFTAPAKAGFMWSMHRINGQRRFWDYHAPIQMGPVSFTLPLPSTLAPSSAPSAPATGKVELNWTPYIRQWEPDSTHPFNARQFSLANLGMDADTQPGASHYLWP